MSTLAFPTLPGRTQAWSNSLGGPLLVAALYFIGAEAAFFVGTLSDKIFAPFWPPNVVLFCAFVLVPPRQWWLYLLAVFPVHVLAEIGVGMPAPQWLVAFATNAAVAMLNAAAARYLLGPLPWFDDLTKTCLYVLITAMISPALVAFGGAFVPILGGGDIAQFWAFWAQWWLSNAVSSLALGPLALAWLGSRNASAHLSVPAVVESSILTAGLFIICAVAFESSRGAAASGLQPALLYLPLPLVLWAVVRFGAKGANGAILVITVALLLRVLKGPTPFMADTPEASVFAIQAFLTSLAIPALLLGAAIDETRRAEMAVRGSEERMAFAAVAADISLWHFDFRSEQFWMTEHGRKMFGFSGGESVTWKSVIDMVHPEDRHAARAAARFAASSDQAVDREFRIIRRDSVIRWIRVRARSECDEQGQRVKISGTFADITANKIIDRELAQQRRDLAHLMRVSMLGQLSGSIAHELTQPLTAILSNAQAAKLLMAEDKPNLSEVAATLDDIIAEDHRAGDVIHHMRGMLKKGDPNFEPVDFNHLIASTLQLLRGELSTRGVKCQCDFSKMLPSVSGDAVQLQQVLLNLVMNAVEAMNELSPSRRMLAIRTQPLEDGGVSIVISDCGTGLVPAHEEKIFQPFFSTKESGMGLGLAICSSIVKLHGGTLNLENNAKEGATAHLIIPGNKAVFL